MRKESLFQVAKRFKQEVVAGRPKRAERYYRLWLRHLPESMLGDFWDATSLFDPYDSRCVWCRQPSWSELRASGWAEGSWPRYAWWARLQEMMKVEPPRKNSGSAP